VYVPVDAQSPPRHGLYPLVHGNESPARPVSLDETTYGMGPRLGGPEGPPP
jgi:hypothetical protein